MNHDEMIQQRSIKLCAIGIALIKEDYPVADSRSGRNTVYHHCDVYQGRPGYASCLMVMDQTFAGTNVLRTECADAIHNGRCPAVEMRKAELKAGKALFYVPYDVLVARRAAQRELERETSPIQFRRPRPDKKFKPTTPVQVLGAEDFKVAPAKPAPSEDDYNTNIMEQVVKKVLNDK